MTSESWDEVRDYKDRALKIGDYVTLYYHFYEDSGSMKRAMIEEIGEESILVSPVEFKDNHTKMFIDRENKFTVKPEDCQKVWVW